MIVLQAPRRWITGRPSSGYRESIARTYADLVGGAVEVVVEVVAEAGGAAGVAGGGGAAEATGGATTKRSVMSGDVGTRAY